MPLPLTDVFALLAHPTRVRILQALRPGEQCVCHLEAVLGLPQAHISQHLAVLRQAGWVIARREGWNVYYYVSRPEVFGVLDAAASLSPPGTTEHIPTSPIIECSCPRCQRQLKTN